MCYWFVEEWWNEIDQDELYKAFKYTKQDGNNNASLEDSVCSVALYTVILLEEKITFDVITLKPIADKFCLNCHTLLITNVILTSELYVKGQGIRSCHLTAKGKTNPNKYTKIP